MIWYLTTQWPLSRDSVNASGISHKRVMVEAVFAGQSHGQKLASMVFPPTRSARLLKLARGRFCMGAQFNDRNPATAAGRASPYSSPRCLSRNRAPRHQPRHTLLHVAFDSFMFCYK